MAEGRPELSDEDARLDRLVLEARSEYSLRADDAKKTYDRAESDRRAIRQQRRKRRVLIAAAIVAGVGLISHMSYGCWKRAAFEKSKAQDIAAERARAATATKEATAEVKRLLSEHKFGDARRALVLAGPKGLPNDVRSDLDDEIIEATLQHTSTEVKRLLSGHEFGDAAETLELARRQGLATEARADIEAEIKKAALAHREGLLDKVEKAIEKRSLETAERLLDRAEALSHYDTDGRRFHKLSEGVRRLEHEKELEYGKQLLAQSRTAAAQKKWDEAVSLVEQAWQEPHEDEELRRWEEELRTRVGGRLRVVGSPPSGTVKVPELEAVPMGEVVAGLKFGPVDVLVAAEGYIPEFAQVHPPAYPEIGELTVNLTPQAPGPLWATFVLSGHCAQELAAKYYARAHKRAAWIDALIEMAGPCTLEESKTRRGKPSKRAPAAKVRAAGEEFLAKGDDPAGALNALAEFTAQYPRSLKTLLKKHGKKIGKHLSSIERGCADCLGRGRVTCVTCGGRGERKEPRPCPVCKGQGRKPHASCDGTGNVACKKCKGTGRIKVPRRVPPGEGPAPESKKAACPSCDGRGKRACRCRGGFVACKKCKTTGQRDMMGPCLACEGRGDTPCNVCEATGRRGKMDPARRREMEMELVPLVDAPGKPGG